MTQQKIPVWYKQTEVGVIPTDWDVKSYGQIFSFLSTASYSRDDLSYDQKVWYVHYWDIHTKRNHFLDLDKYPLPSISEDKVKNYSSIREWDIIMADASEDYAWISKSVEVKNIWSKKAISWLHTFLLRDTNWCFINGYKWYISNTKVVKNQFDRLATWLKVYGLSKNSLKNVFIPIPTLAEQTRIAKTLSDTDELISQLDELITKKRQIKQWAMQKLLSPKKDWEVKKLGEICGKITTGRLDDKYAFDTEALLVSGNGANVWYIHYFKGKFNAYQRTYVLSNFSEHILFIKIFMDKYLQERIRVEVNAGNTPYITMWTLTEMEITIPKSKEEQIRIATILSDIDNEIQILEQKKAKYEQIKQWTMQQLLTGKIRLK